MNNIETLYINTPLGHHIGLTQFNPSESNNYTVVISSATGVLQHYYRKFALHFSQLGYTVYTFDYSGIGISDSKPKLLKRNTNKLDVWGKNDQATIIEYALNEKPSHKLILITHSIGGQILCLNKYINKLDAIVMVASQSGYWKHWKGFERIKMVIFWNIFIPLITPLFGYFPSKLMGLFENLPKQMVYQWRRWAQTKNYMLSEFKHEDLHFSEFNKPLLSLSFPRDEYAPKSAVDWLTQQFVNAKIDRRHIIPKAYQIENVGHFGFFRDTFRSSLWKMTDNWIKSNR